MPKTTAGRDTRTYADHLAGLMAATALSRRGAKPDAASQAKLARAIMRQPAFRELLNDERAVKLMRDGRGSDLCALFLLKDRKLNGPRGPYARPASLSGEDADFLKTAKDSMKGGQAQGSAAELERESKLLAELKKQMDHAQSLAEKGIALDERDSSALVTAAKRYNDGGSRIPGGRREAPYSKQAMCILSRYMPKEEFRSYCAGINRARGAEAASSRGHVEPDDYTKALLTGAARPASELMTEAGRRLSSKITVENCAVAAAVHKLSGGNPNAIISREALDNEVSLLKKPGSAFMQVMRDDKARGQFARLAAGGNALKIGRTITEESRRYSVRAAAVQMQRSMEAAAKGHGSIDTAAEIIAAKQLAGSSDPSAGVTAGAFRERVESIKSSSSFTRLSERYDSDPGFRETVDRELASGDRSGFVERELEKQAQAPQREREREASPALTY